MTDSGVYKPKCANNYKYALNDVDTFSQDRLKNSSEIASMTV